MRRLPLLLALALVVAACDLASDDFTSPVLGGRWTVVDPLGDGDVSLGTSNDGSGTLDLSVPAGTEHDAWIENHSLRAVQQVDDRDTGIEVKFSSVPTERFQAQGLLFQEDADTFLRFDLHSNGSTLRAFAALIDDGSSTTLRNVAIPIGGQLFLRVTRVADTWTMETSLDGEDWVTRLQADRALDLTAIGVFAGNAASSGQPVPAFTARVDHVFNTAHPISPEDGDPPPADVTPPEITGLTVDAGPAGLSVDWQTDELTTGLVQIGLTPALELGATPSPTTGLAHHVDVGGLDQDTTYHLSVVATDLSGNPTTSPPLEVTTTSAEGPSIDLWYGDTIASGSPGRPQTWINLLGNLSSTAGIDTFTYSLNGGPALPLSLGPDTRRLLRPGDFNVELDHDQLDPGPNTVELVATDILDQVLARTLHVVATVDATWPLPYSTSWSTATAVPDQAHVIDGEWSVSGNTISPDDVGYDRLVAIGDRTWTNYEVTVPVTLLSLEPLYQSPSNGAALGLLVNWQGHVAVGQEQPRRGYEPLGAYASFRWNTNGTNRWQLLGSYGQPQMGTATPAWQVGETYVLKVRSESVPTGSRFSFKYWPASGTEPVPWSQTIVDTDTSNSGSVVLLAHHVDAAFGDVTVVPISGGAGE